MKCYSAGTEKQTQIKPKAVQILKEFGIDMELNQPPKPAGKLPWIYIVMTIGCNVKCPILPYKHRKDWGIEDPNGKNDRMRRLVIGQIKKIDNWMNQIRSNTLYFWAAVMQDNFNGGF